MTDAVAALRFDPLLPAWALAGLGLVCLLAAALGLWRRAPGSLLRTLLFATLLAWLAGPRLVREAREALGDVTLVMLDESGSMQVGDRQRVAAAARDAVAEAAARLPGMEVRTATLPEGGRDGTRLMAAIARAAADIPQGRLSAVVAITDGQVHDIGATALPGVPLHVLVPARGEETDRRIRVIEAPSYGLVGRSVTLRVEVDDLGAVPGAGPGTARLTIRRDGMSPRTQPVPVGREQRIELPITRAGPGLVELEVDPLPGEVSTLNNRTVIALNGVRDRLRVLLVSGEPHAGERTWRRLLKADPAVDLVHFTILRPPERDDMTPLNELALIAFPVRELFQVKIRDFDLIILDRFGNRGLLPAVYLRNIADYVRAGGALLVSAGPEFAGAASLSPTPLGSVLPARATGPASVVEQAFSPAVTPLGLRHPVTEGLPGWRADGPPGWGRWYRRIAAPTARGQSVMAGPDGSPLLVLDHVDEGRVALLLSDQIWLWSRGHEGGGPQAELLRRVAHWLMKEPALEEEALRARIASGRLEVERRSLDERAELPVTVTPPQGEATPLLLRQVAPGRLAGGIDAAAPGIWQVSDGVHTAYAAAEVADPVEIADLRATGTVLAPAIRASGGSLHWLEPAGIPAVRATEPGRDAGGRQWIGLPRRHEHVVLGVTAVPLLPGWAALPLLLALAVLAWRREGARPGKEARLATPASGPR